MCENCSPDDPATKWNLIVAALLLGAFMIFMNLAVDASSDQQFEELLERVEELRERVEELSERERDTGAADSAPRTLDQVALGQGGADELVGYVVEGRSGHRRVQRGDRVRPQAASGVDRG